MYYKFEYFHELDRTQRADIFLTSTIDGVSRAALKKRLTSLVVNGKAAKLSLELKSGDIVEVELNEPELDIDFFKPNDIELDIIYEDDHTIVINKPQGLVVHPAVGHPDDTLVNALVHKYTLTGSEEIPERAGIVHRLDKDTSGVILVAKTEAALEYYSSQFADHSARKVYYAIVKGKIFPLTGRIETFQSRDRANRKRYKDTTDANGKVAITDYEVIEHFQGYTYIKMMPKTGRTHQLRVHFSGKGWPILGDPIYSRKDNNFPETTLMLHAQKLEIKLFETKATVRFRADIPERFEAMLEVLRRDYP
ncbi:MAG: RluA family pseudouridine synthase [Spirochaetales bacterium]|nr:RluA family pseudouridine synthase [Spirochaetales bacterium]